MRTRHAILGATTSLGFVPALVVLMVAVNVQHALAPGGLLYIRFPGTHVFANQQANLALLFVLAATWTAWILAYARRWVTGATGGGFTIAATALVLRLVVELPQEMAQVPLAETRPPDPYGTLLPLMRGFGIVVFVFGLGCVLAACLSERRLRRSGPAWTLPR